MNDSMQHSRGLRSTGAVGLLGMALAIGSSLGCSWLAEGPIEDLGDTQAGLPAPDPEPVPNKDYLEQTDPEFVGHWVGYVEDPTRRGEDGQLARAVFASGSTQVTLDYRLEGQFAHPAGTLVFGAGPAPAVEAGVAYPPGFDTDWTAAAAPGGGNDWKAPVVEGFEYSLRAGEGAYGYDPGHTSLLEYAELGAFDEWCDVQATLPADDCLEMLPLAAGNFVNRTCTQRRSDGTEVPVNCRYAWMCGSNLCDCLTNTPRTDFACYTDISLRKAQVWLERSGDEIIGTVSGALIRTDRPGYFAPVGLLHLYRVGD